MRKCEIVWPISGSELGTTPHILGRAKNQVNASSAGGSSRVHPYCCTSPPPRRQSPSRGGSQTSPRRPHHQSNPLHSPQPRSISSLVVALSLCLPAPPIRSSGPIAANFGRNSPEAALPVT